MAALIIRQISPSLHKALKVKAAQEDKTLSALLIEILQAAVKN